jgi:hypothetical protein
MVQTKKSRFTIYRRIFQDSRYLTGYSRKQTNTWTDWKPFHDIQSIYSLNKSINRLSILEKNSTFKCEFKIVNNCPTLLTQHQFNLLYDNDDVTVKD